MKLIDDKLYLMYREKYELHALLK